MAKAKPTVQYRDIQGFPDYRVGDDGSVWSCKRQIGLGYRNGFVTVRGEWHRLTVSLDAAGRPSLTLMPGRRTRLVCRLVLETFVGPCPLGMECCHGDGRPTNNNLSNLRWDTPKGNAADRIRHGTSCQGERQHLAKLSNAKVRSIRSDYAAGRSINSLMAAHGVSRNTIWRVVLKQTWKHVAS